jgi:hypothetical protein
MAVHTPNTIESLRKACSEKDWDGYDADPMPEIVFRRAEAIQPYIPQFFELFPGGDGSLQWEWHEHRKNGHWDIIEVYPLNYYFTDNYDVDKEFKTPEEMINFLKEKYKCLAG